MHVTNCYTVNKWRVSGAIDESRQRCQCYSVQSEKKDRHAGLQVAINRTSWHFRPHFNNSLATAEMADRGAPRAENILYSLIFSNILDPLWRLAIIQERHTHKHTHTHTQPVGYKPNRYHGRRLNTKLFDIVCNYLYREREHEA